MKAFLFLFGGIGVINGLLYSLYAFLNSNRSKKGILFGALVAMLSIRIGKSIYYHFIPVSDKSIRQIGLSACILIGPLFFLYVNAYLKDQQKWKTWEVLMLGVILASIVVIGLVFPYSHFNEIWNHYVVHYIYATWFVFLVAGLVIQKSLWTRLINEGKKSIVNEERRVLMISTALVFISATYFFALYINGFTYLWASLIFTAVFYLLVYLELRTKFSLVAVKKESLPIAEQQALMKQLNELVDKNEMYLDPKFKLEQLARAAAMPKNLVSRVLNEGYENGYTHFINEKRISRAKELILVNNHLSLEGIGLESGFNSKSSFYSVFKKYTKMTPAAFKKSVISPNAPSK